MVIHDKNNELTKLLPSPFALAYASIVRRDPGVATCLHLIELVVMYATAVLRAQATTLDLPVAADHKLSLGARLNLIRSLERSITESGEEPVFALASTKKLSSLIETIVKARNDWAHAASRSGSQISKFEFARMAVPIFRHVSEGTVLIKAASILDKYDSRTFFELKGISGTREPKECLVSLDNATLELVSAVFRSNRKKLFVLDPFIQACLLSDGSYGFTIQLDDHPSTLINPAESWNSTGITNTKGLRN